MSIFEGQFSNESYKARVYEAIEDFNSQNKRNILKEWESVIFHLPYAFHGRRMIADKWVEWMENNGDSELTQFSWFFFTCLLGLFIFNFPRGFLFIGDGGAYLLGCIIAVMAIMLAERNYNVSSFASLLIVSYPIYETVRSFIRRTLDKNTNFSIADDRHLHNFMYKFFSKLINLDDTNQNKIWIPNAIAGASCCVLPAITGMVAIIFQANMPILVSCLFVTLILYEICLFLLKKV